MKLNCHMADDLLPLYLEDICSEESREALEEHLRVCPACREKCARMRKRDILPQGEKTESAFPIAGYVRKIKRRRIRIGIFAALMSMLAACVLSLCFLAVSDMHRQANPIVFGVEEGVYNLTAADLETTAAEAGAYILYTNSEKIQVRMQADGSFDGDVILWNATDKDEPAEIAYGHIDTDHDTCVFTGLSASQRYRVTWEGDKQVTLIISEGRAVSFWNSMKNVLAELLSFR